MLSRLRQLGRTPEFKALAHGLSVVGLIFGLLFIEHMYAAPMFAQSGRLVASESEIPNLGALVGKTVCLVITEDREAPDSKYEVCTKVTEVTRWTMPSLSGLGTLHIKVDAEYRAAKGSSRISKIWSRGKDQGWTAAISFDDEEGRPYFRGVPVKQFFVYE